MPINLYMLGVSGNFHGRNKCRFEAVFRGLKFARAPRLPWGLPWRLIAPIDGGGKDLKTRK